MEAGGHIGNQLSSDESEHDAGGSAGGMKVGPLRRMLSLHGGHGALSAIARKIGGVNVAPRPANFLKWGRVSLVFHMLSIFVLLSITAPLSFYLIALMVGSADGIPLLARIWFWYLAPLLAVLFWMFSMATQKTLNLNESAQGDR